MLKDQRSHNIEGIEFKVIYSGRRSIGISVLPDSSVIVRAPYLSSLKTIGRIVQQKADWIIKHIDNYKQRGNKRLNGLYASGEIHLFRGKESVLQIEKTNRSYIRFSDHTIELGLDKTDDPMAVKDLLYKGYKSEALIVFPELLSMVLKKLESQVFNPTGLVIRSMKSRWGSCSKKGTITLSTELIKLPDKYLEYVIIHELCHLKHHNHGKEYYDLLSELFPGWKQVRKDLKEYTMW
jgi:predicted metal-dependent hydrolase